MPNYGTVGSEHTANTHAIYARESMFKASPALRKTGILLALVVASCLSISETHAAIGDRAKLEGTLIRGGRYALDEHRGKVVLVVLWATWCPICRRELPKLDAFYREHSKQGFEIVAASVDDTENVVKDFVAKNHFAFDIAWRKRMQDNLGAIRGTPTIVLIDRTGVIRARTEGALDDGAWWAIEDEIARPAPQAQMDRKFLPQLLRRAL